MKYRYIVYRLVDQIVPKGEDYRPDLHDVYESQIETSEKTAVKIANLWMTAKRTLCDCSRVDEECERMPGYWESTGRTYYGDYGEWMES